MINIIADIITPSSADIASYIVRPAILEEDGISYILMETSEKILIE